MPRMRPLIRRVEKSLTLYPALGAFCSIFRITKSSLPLRNFKLIIIVYVKVHIDVFPW